MSTQGPWGPAGPQGPTGMTGRKGHQGDGFGPEGIAFYSGGYVSFVSIIQSTLTPFSVTASGSGTYYSLINTNPGTGSCTVTLPATPPQGTFWVFFNGRDTEKLQITLVNGTAVYNGNPAAALVEIASHNGCILAYDVSSATYIVF